MKYYVLEGTITAEYNVCLPIKEKNFMRLLVKIMSLLLLLAAVFTCDNPGAVAGNYTPAVLPVAKFAYVASGSDVISVFSVGSDGSLTAVDTVNAPGTGPEKCRHSSDFESIVCN